MKQPTEAAGKLRKMMGLPTHFFVECHAVVFVTYRRAVSRNTDGLTAVN